MNPHFLCLLPGDSSLTCELSPAFSEMQMDTRKHVKESFISPILVSPMIDPHQFFYLLFNHPSLQTLIYVLPHVHIQFSVNATHVCACTCTRAHTHTHTHTHPCFHHYPLTLCLQASLLKRMRMISPWRQLNEPMHPNLIGK